MLFLCLLSLFEKNNLLKLDTNVCTDTKFYPSRNTDNIIDKEVIDLLDILDMIDEEFIFLYELEDTE